MTISTALLCRLIVTDTLQNGDEVRRDIASTISSGILKVEQITLAGGFNALSPPSGAKYLVVEFISAGDALTLKGPTGDTGIVLTTSAVNPTAPLCVPLASGSALGFAQSDGGSVLKLYWL